MIASLAGVLINLALLTGCGDTTVQQTGDDVDPMPMPDSTIPVVEHTQECSYQYQIREVRITAEYGQCKQDGGDAEVCNTTQQTQFEDSRSSWELCMRELPAVSKECRDQFEPLSTTHDSDGDGISDMDEVFMFYNPCEPCSFGGYAEDCDGLQDWDDDGESNADDETPRCNPDQGLLTTYCV